MLEEFWDFIHVHNTTLTHKNLVGVFPITWDRCYGQRKNPWGLVVAMLTRFCLLRMLIAMQDLMQADALGQGGYGVMEWYGGG